MIRNPFVERYSASASRFAKEPGPQSRAATLVYSTARSPIDFRRLRQNLLEVVGRRRRAARLHHRHRMVEGGAGQINGALAGLERARHMPRAPGTSGPNKAADGEPTGGLAFGEAETCLRQRPRAERRP